MNVNLYIVGVSSRHDDIKDRWYANIFTLANQPSKTQGLLSAAVRVTDTLAPELNRTFAAHGAGWYNVSQVAIQMGRDIVYEADTMAFIDKQPPSPISSLHTGQQK